MNNLGPLHALNYVLLYEDQFRPEFARYLTKHWRPIREFFAIAEDQWTGLNHRRAGLSARSVAEVIRDQGFKLDGNFVPDIAELYEFLHPEHSGLFSKRKRRVL